MYKSCFGNAGVKHAYASYFIQCIIIIETKHCPVNRTFRWGRVIEPESNVSLLTCDRARIGFSLKASPLEPVFKRQLSSGPREFIGRRDLDDIITTRHCPYSCHRRHDISSYPLGPPSHFHPVPSIRSNPRLLPFNRRGIGRYIHIRLVCWWLPL